MSFNSLGFFFAACGWQAAVFHSSLNISHPPPHHYDQNTRKGREVEGGGKMRITAKVEWMCHCAQAIEVQIQR